MGQTTAGFLPIWVHRTIAVCKGVKVGAKFVDVLDIGE